MTVTILMKVGSKNSVWRMRARMTHPIKTTTLSKYAVQTTYKSQSCANFSQSYTRHQTIKMSGLLSRALNNQGLRYEDLYDPTNLTQILEWTANPDLVDTALRPVWEHIIDLKIKVHHHSAEELRLYRTIVYQKRNVVANSNVENGIVQELLELDEEITKVDNRLALLDAAENGIDENWPSLHKRFFDGYNEGYRKNISDLFVNHEIYFKLKKHPGWIPRTITENGGYFRDDVGIARRLIFESKPILEEYLRQLYGADPADQVLEYDWSPVVTSNEDSYDTSEACDRWDPDLFSNDPTVESARNCDCTNCRKLVLGEEYADETIPSASSSDVSHEAMAEYENEGALQPTRPPLMMDGAGPATVSSRPVLGTPHTRYQEPAFVEPPEGPPANLDDPFDENTLFIRADVLRLCQDVDFMQFVLSGHTYPCANLIRAAQLGIENAYTNRYPHLFDQMRRVAIENDVASEGPAREAGMRDALDAIMNNYEHMWNDTRMGENTEAEADRSDPRHHQDALADLNAEIDRRRQRRDLEAELFPSVAIELNFEDEDTPDPESQPNESQLSASPSNNSVDEAAGEED